MKKLVYGHGINDLPRRSCFLDEDENRKQKVYWSRWRQMLRRAYSSEFQEIHKSYIGVTVCEEWHLLSNFVDWMKKQDWIGKDLDKDIMYPKNKVYSPDTCIFIAPYINKLMTNSMDKIGKHPTGVHYVKHLKKYRARINVFGKKKHLGYFKTPKGASIAYNNEKIKIIKTIISETKDDRLAIGLNRHISFIEGGRIAS